MGGVFYTPAVVGRSPMAWRTRPCNRGDLLLCMGVLPRWSKRPMYEADAINLQCGVNAGFPPERCVQSSLPCVGRVNRGDDALSSLAGELTLFP